jgi:hypothetical protein
MNGGQGVMELVYTLEDVIEELNDIEGACDRVWFEMEYRKEKHLFRKTSKTLTVVVMIKYQLKDSKGLLEGKVQPQKQEAARRDLPAYAKGMQGGLRGIARSGVTVTRLLCVPLLV